MSAGRFARRCWLGTTSRNDFPEDGANESGRMPKHASWLNMVEIEIGVLRGQCLDRRIASRDQLLSEIDAWQSQRNDAAARVKWMFTTERARNKLARAHPNSTKES